VSPTGSPRPGQDVVLWARRWARRPTAAEHELLEVSKSSTLEAVRAAYHKLARFAHPDLHRSTLTEEQLEEVTVAFARVSNAYALMSGRLRRGGGAPAPSSPSSPSSSSSSSSSSAPAPPPSASAPAQATAAAPVRPSPAVAAPASGGGVAERGRPADAPLAAPFAPSAESGSAAPTETPRRSLPIGPANAMAPRALVHYRRAELAMRRGAEAEAMLHLRLAVASDPQSSFLRKALADIGGD
jgi:DnaJ domain